MLNCASSGSINKIKHGKGFSPPPLSLYNLRLRYSFIITNFKFWILIKGCLLAIREVFKRGLFYAKFYADFFVNSRQALYFGLFFKGIFMLILKVSSLFCLITSMITRGTLELQYTCSARLMVYSLISLKAIVLWLCYEASWHVTERQLKTKGCIYLNFLLGPR